MTSAAGGQTYLVDELYGYALAQGIVQPFERLEEGYIDLHHHSVYMAEARLHPPLLVILAQTHTATLNYTTPL